MSIATLKKKSAVVNSKNHSVNKNNILWVANPFIPASSGFSLNGPHRNVGQVGQNMRMSKAFTPFKGTLPTGHGGSGGKYPINVVYNVTDSSTLVKGTQYLYNKSSVLSTYGMLRQKYRWAYSGTYPNYWVQPDSNNGEYNSSQSAYINKKSSDNTCIVKSEDGIDIIKTFDSNKGRLDCANNYTKTLNNVIDSSIHTHNITQPCTNQTDAQLPYPHAVNNSGCAVPSACG